LKTEGLPQTEQVDDVESFIQTPIVQKVLKGRFGRNYATKSNAAKMEEFAVKASRGQWEDFNFTTKKDQDAAARVAIEYLDKFAEKNQREGLSQDQMLRQLAREIVFNEEARRIQEEIQGKRATDVQSPKDSNQQDADGQEGGDVSGERQETKPTTTRVTPVLESRTPGKSGVDFDAEKAQEAKEQGQKVVAFSRIAGQEIYRTPKTNEETEAQAANLISDIGTQQAIQNALTGKPDATGMRVVYKEFERLNALYNYHKEQGNDAEAKVIGEYLGNLANSIVERQQATGQESQIARTLDILSPDIAVLMAQRRILNTRGIGATLTDEEIAKTQELGREQQEIEVKIEKEREGLRKSSTCTGSRFSYTGSLAASINASDSPLNSDESGNRSASLLTISFLSRR